MKEVCEKNGRLFGHYKDKLYLCANPFMWSTDMNTLSLNSLWSYIQSLSLTDSNKRWLADHLYESTKVATGRKKSITTTSAGHLLLAEDELPECVRNLIGVAAPARNDDVNGRDAYYAHLAEKYA